MGRRRGSSVHSYSLYSTSDRAPKPLPSRAPSRTTAHLQRRGKSSSAHFLHLLPKARARQSAWLMGRRRGSSVHYYSLYSTSDRDSKPLPSRASLYSMSDRDSKPLQNAATAAQRQCVAGPWGRASPERTREATRTSALCSGACGEAGVTCTRTRTGTGLRCYPHPLTCSGAPQPERRGHTRHSRALQTTPTPSAPHQLARSTPPAYMPPKPHLSLHRHLHGHRGCGYWRWHHARGHLRVQSKRKGVRV